MRTTIDSAGRIVIPKALREQAGLRAGAQVDVELRDGRLEIEPAAVTMRVVEKGRRTVIEADAEMPTMTSEDVRAVLENVRR